MAATRKSVMIWMISFLVNQALGEIKISVNLSIPTAKGDIFQECMMVITREGIQLNCKKKIFRLFNIFDAPGRGVVMIRMEEIKEIEVQIGDRQMFIITQDSFTLRYNHLFHRVYRNTPFTYPYREPEQALIFTMNETVGLDVLCEELKRNLGDRVYIF